MHPILDAFEQTCTARGRNVAASDQSLTLDYASIRSFAAGLGRQIADRTGLERVGILAPTSTACAVSVFAAWYAGKIPIPLNFLLPAPELAKVVADAQIDLMITIDRFAETVASTGVKTLILNGKTTLVPGEMDAPQRDGSDTGVILYTSGTSGDPKGVCLSFENLAANCRSCAEHARMNPDQVFLSLLPQFHSFGLTALTILPLTLGATVHYLPRFSPVTVVNTIAERKVSVFIAVASMFSALIRTKRADREALSSLELIISGGEPLPASVAQAFEEKFGKTIFEGYGLTETSPVASLNLPWASRPGSVGVPLPGITIKAVGPQGNEMARGEDGELLISGHCVMQGYYNRPKETAEAVRDGWLHTGDVGRVDGDGFVYITGRAKDMMIIGGENVYPREIESVLESHPAVAEAAVIGVRDDVRGELPIGFVILKDGVATDDTALREHCRAHLAGFKVPRSITISEELPRGATGKILKRALKAP
ncbi:MAG: AMP-binding protein [Planctomycetes bacterium]|nr:AMP-binding protein [Planctomycetota bacterium]